MAGRDSSSSDPHFLLHGHPRDTAGKQGSHFLISCYTQQTRLKCSISCCSLPAAIEGKNNPSATNRYNQSHLCAPAVSLNRHGGGQEGREGGREEGEAWMWTYPYSWLHLCKTLRMCGIVLLAHSFVFPKINCHCEKTLGFCRTCVSEILPCVEKASKPCGPYRRVILIAFGTGMRAPVCTHIRDTTFTGNVAVGNLSHM